jgi:MFS family permease
MPRSSGVGGGSTPPTGRQGAAPLWNGPYIGLMAVNLLSALNFNMVATSLPKYLVRIGASLAVAGALAGSFSITALIVRPLSGAAADRLNSKRLCMLGFALTCVACLGYAFSSTLPAMLAFRILHGAAFGITSTVSIALLIPHMPAERLGEGIGYYGLSQIIAQAVGPGIGVALSDSFGYRAMFLAVCAVALLATVLMGLFPRGPAKEGPAPAGGGLRISDLISREAIPYAILGGLFSLTNGIVMTFILLYGGKKGIPGIGLFFVVNAAMLFIVRPLSGKLVDRRGLNSVLYPALAVTAAAMLLLGLANSLWVILAAAALKAMGQGAGQPALQAECISRAGKGRSGVASSTFYIGADIFQGFGPALGGAISSSFGFEAMFYLCGALIALAIMVSFVCSWRRRQKAA